MTDRTLSSEIKSASEGDFFSFIIAAAIEFDGGTVYVHNAVGEYTIGGQTYTGLGDFAFIEPITEGAEVSSYPIKIGLSGIDDALKQSGTDFFNLVTSEDFYGRNVTLHIGAIMADGSLDGTPTEWGTWQMQSPDVQVGAQNLVSVTAESEMAIFDKRNGARYSDADLQDEYSGDLGFEYLERMVNARIVWRGERANVAGGGGTRTPRRQGGFTYQK